MSEQRQEFQSSDRPHYPVSLSHLVHTLRNYLPVISLGFACVMVGYVIIATAAYLLSPSQRMTSQPFRLDFKGAERGEYPNGLKFATNEIVATPVLLRVYNNNNLSRFITFPEFSRSVVVLESNSALEALAREYQARLTDPKLTPVDRERIQREYELKQASINKGQYAVNYLRSVHGTDIPDELVRKVLNDILTEWANYVVNEQHVLDHRLSVLSPEVVSVTPSDGTNPMIIIDMLRARALRVRQNIGELRSIPGAELARTAGDAMSLRDITVRIDEIVRFRLEPLSHRVAAAQLDDRAETIRFFESQLAFDLRQLESQKRVAEASRSALTLYLVGERAPDPLAAPPAGDPSGGTVMPQLSESFLERLIQLTSNRIDSEYRQTLTDQYHQASLGIVPVQEAVAYHENILAFVRTGVSGDSITRDVVDQQILATRNDVRGLVTKMREIYKNLSLNLNVSTALLTRTGAPATRVSRALSVRQLALYGVLTAFVTLPLLILISLIHNRVREEDEAADVVRPEVVERTA